MSWRRRIGFALVALLVLFIMRSSCHAPGYDVRRLVRRPHRSRTRPAPRLGDTQRAPAAPAGSSAAPWLPPAGDDDAIDEARDTGTWSPPSATPAPSVPQECPRDMVLAEGDYCPEPQQTCLHWIDEGSTFLPNHRCAKFQSPSKCLSKERVYMKFCIDRDEHGDPTSGLPDTDQSWTMAAHTCGAEDKRLCAEAEWVFACEGPEMLPYPTGFERDPSRCNFDQTALTDHKGNLKDLRKPANELSRCTSPFGARNLVGNVDEWVIREGIAYPPFRSALKGGWWMAARNRCRPATTAHDEHYRDAQTGFRCCRDAR